MVPIWIRTRLKMSRIHNTTFTCKVPDIANQDRGNISQGREDGCVGPRPLVRRGHDRARPDHESVFEGRESVLTWRL